jgi:hypothetical protein
MCVPHTTQYENNRAVSLWVFGTVIFREVQLSNSKFPMGKEYFSKRYFTPAEAEGKIGKRIRARVEFSAVPKANRIKARLLQVKFS